MAAIDNMGSIGAVVVTFNRLDLLKQVIRALRNQTRRLDEIIVVNNGSSDGTSSWLSEQRDLNVVTQPNTGSSGGQYAGMKTAYEKGHDWVWCMDDDVVVASDCLERMADIAEAESKAGVLVPARYMNGAFYGSECRRVNVTNPFLYHLLDRVGASDLGHPCLPIQGFTFEGPLISRKVIAAIGYPTADYFLIFDDTDFSLRVFRAGFVSLLVPGARMDRMVPTKNAPVNWRNCISFRNSLAFDRRYGNWAVRTIRPIMHLLHWLLSYAKSRVIGRPYMRLADILKVFRFGMSSRLRESNDWIRSLRAVEPRGRE